MVAEEKIPMKKFIQRRKVMLAALGGALLMLILIAIALIASPIGAFAASAATSPTTTKNTKAHPYCTLYQQTLAKELNISVDTLRQDNKNALIAVIQQKEKDGKLTQAQATKAEQRIDKSQGNLCNFAKKHPKQQLLNKYRTDILTEVAQKLQIQPAQLTAQLKAGKSLHDIASAKNISDSQLQSYITTAIKDTLQKAVTTGTITQQRANTINTFIQQHPQYIQRMINHQAKQAK
jgi:hypothetical protein